MNQFDKDYLNLVKNVTISGQYQNDRTGAGRINKISSTLEFNMELGFPLLQVKKTPFKLMVKELLWFISGGTNIKTLVHQKVNIWSDDSYNYYLRLFESEELHLEREPLTKEQFIDNLGEECEGIIGYKYGDLGNVYGKYWKDQLPKVIEDIKSNPFSARHRVSCWYPEEQGSLDCALNPCHYGFQFICEGEDKISLVFSMRSTDTFLGLPINISSYGLLLSMVGELVGRKPSKLVFQGVNTHIYVNHIEAVEKLIQQSEEMVDSSYPQLLIKNKRESVFDYKLEDFEILNYKPNNHIYAPLNT
jgi:thymidylate synthase